MTITLVSQMSLESLLFTELQIHCCTELMLIESTYVRTTHRWTLHVATRIERSDSKIASKTKKSSKTIRKSERFKEASTSRLPSFRLTSMLMILSSLNLERLKSQPSLLKSWKFRYSQSLNRNLSLHRALSSSQLVKIHTRSFPNPT